MPSLADHQGAKSIRALYIGDPTTGKTGSLASLVAAGYKLRILDYDNKLSVLKHFVMETCPDKINNVSAIPLRDVYVTSNQGPYVKSPKAYTQGVALLNKWEDDTIPQDWGPEYIFVIDSLSAMDRSAFEWAKGMNPGTKDPRQWYHTAQQSVWNMLLMATSEAFTPHVIIISHVHWKEGDDGMLKGWANSIGSALDTEIGRVFNSIILAGKKGQGSKLRRVILTTQQDAIDLITPAPFRIDAELPLDTGLATIFEALT
jgi:hypothetical protein